nr:hypothetical protein [Bradyrhizobium nanningense]
MRSRFPTRQYPYRVPTSGVALGTIRDPLADAKVGDVVRFFLGRDDEPIVLTQEAVSRDLNDPFGHLVLGAGHRPTNLQDVLKILDQATGPDALPEQRLYRVADGGQIAWSSETAKLDRHLRLVVTRHRGQDAELFISTAPPFDSPDIFLQIFAWDPKSAAYNFYERRRGVWSWAGSSWEALEEPTRGHGPFDSHINGGPVMKELKAPWMHWHSQAAPIGDEMLAPDDPLLADAFYHGTDLKGGEDLELLVRSGIARWTKSRFDRFVVGGRLTYAKGFFRQISTTTTVNIACSPQQSASLSDEDVLRLPTTFFLNSDCLVDELKLEVSLARLKAPAAFYRASCKKHGVRLKDGEVTLEKDTYFAFPIPEPSFEDEMVLRELLARGVLSRRLAIALLSLDFPNPVFSERRAALLEFMPSDSALDGGAGLDKLFSDAVRASPRAADPASPESEFLRFWDKPAGSGEVELVERIQAYWKAIGEKISTSDGFDDVFRLAESRRRQFRKRPLSEFDLTLPCAANLEIPTPLRMTESGHIEATSGLS